MGKAALFFVAAFSMAGARLLYTSQEADIKSAANQGAYEADVIAREIARSAYNAATADVHRFGNDIDRALVAFGPRVETDCANNKPFCFRRTGEMLGGTYLVEASIDGGNGVDIFASGTYGYTAGTRPVSQTHTINEAQSVGVLQVADGGKLRIQFVDSQAGYCSAIFLKRTVPGLPADEQPGIEMVYAPGKNRNGGRNAGLELDLAAGTQMNFAIGVDTNCGGKKDERDKGKYRGSRPSNPRFAHLRMDRAADLLEPLNPTGPASSFGPQVLADSMANYVYNPDDWAWTHWALDGSALRDGDPKEGPWAMVETDPNNNQRWRIAFEDISDWNLAPDDPGYNNPNLSLWATKQFGYDFKNGDIRKPGNDGVGDGWTDNECLWLEPKADGSGYTVREDRGQPDGFHDLRDTSSPADFSDQVIFVEILPPDANLSELERTSCLAPA